VDEQRSHDGTLIDLRQWDDLTRHATACHHWERESGAGPMLGLPPALLRQDVELLNPGQRGPAATPDEPLPLVSALMVTRDRPALAVFAIDCFRRQTYPNKELIIVDDGKDDTLAREVARMADPAIRMIRRPDRGELLGTLRNVAVEASAGTLVCTWDDDDLSHPLRLETQIWQLRHTGAQACLLTRLTLWWVDSKQFALGEKRFWEGSIVCRKDVLPRYPEVQVREDTPVVNRLLHSVCVVGVDQPRLYIYVVHGNNSWYPNFFMGFWRAAERHFEGPRADRMYRELDRDLPLTAYARAWRAAPRTP